MFTPLTLLRSKIVCHRGNFGIGITLRNLVHQRGFAFSFFEALHPNNEVVAIKACQTGNRTARGDAIGSMAG